MWILKFVIFHQFNYLRMYMVLEAYNFDTAQPIAFLITWQGSKTIVTSTYLIKYIRLI